MKKASDEELLSDIDRRFTGDGPVRSIPVQKPVQGADAAIRPAILIWGCMCGCERVIRQQLNHLPVAEDDYHGTLRVVLTQSLELVENAKRLLKMLDEGGGF